MDTDLMTLWLNAEFLSQDEARALITELQAARDGVRDDIADVRKAFDDLADCQIVYLDDKINALGAAIEVWESQ